MTQRFAFNELTGTDITDCPLGLAWRLSQHAYAAELILMLDAEDDEHLLFVKLNGANAFDTVWGRMPQPGSATVIPLDTQSLVIELPDSPRNTGELETPGALIVTPQGKFLGVRNVFDNRYDRFRYVSLEDFTIHDYLPTQRYGIFSKWRLTTSDTNMIDRSVLISLGDWV